MRHSLLLPLALGLVLAGTAGAQNPREKKVRDDRTKVEADGFWIYNDLPAALAEAKKTGQPLIVALRCIPCEECVKLDDDLVNKDKRVRPLLEKFIRVRIVSTNGLDLKLFQYDYDQSFAVFFLNADGTIYGRFGTRSHRTSWSDDVSIEGLARALQGALDLHAEYPKNRAELAGKTGPAPDFASPEKYPSLKDRYTAKLNYEGQVVPSCIHCHQVGDAQRQYYRSKGKAIPEQLLFSYPHPKTLGLVLDPKEKATVLRVEKKSLAAEAGFEAGDVILRLGGQPLLSMADVQWVLHQAPADGATLKAEVRRGGRTVEVTLTLPKGWRRAEDISWRASTWGLRRMASGGLLLEDLPAEERKKAGLSETGMALRVKYAGQGNGPHGAAARAGVRQGDVLVSFDGQTDLRRETDLLAYALLNRKVGDTVTATLLRDGKKIEVKLPMQE
jgi:serine protease Do